MVIIHLSGCLLENMSIKQVKSLIVEISSQIKVGCLYNLQKMLSNLIFETDQYRNRVTN